MVPAHVADEYNRNDRPFYPTPSFGETKLPRGHSDYDCITWFPLAASSGLGFNFGYIRRTLKHGSLKVKGSNSEWISPLDLIAITRLCKVRTSEYNRLKQQLIAKPIAGAPLVVEDPETNSRCVVC